MMYFTSLMPKKYSIVLCYRYKCPPGSIIPPDLNDNIIKKLVFEHKPEPKSDQEIFDFFKMSSIEKLSENASRLSKKETEARAGLNSSETMHCTGATAEAAIVTVSDGDESSTTNPNMLETEMAKCRREDDQFSLVFSKDDRVIWAQILTLLDSLSQNHKARLRQVRVDTTSLRKMVDDLTATYVKYSPTLPEAKMEYLMEVMRNRAFMENILTGWENGSIMEQSLAASRQQMEGLSDRVQRVSLSSQEFLIDKTYSVMTGFMVDVLDNLKDCIAQNNGHQGESKEGFKGENKRMKTE